MAGTSGAKTALRAFCPAMRKTDDSRLYRLPFVTGSAIISRAHLISRVDLCRSRQHLRRRSYTRILMLDCEIDLDRRIRSLVTFEWLIGLLLGAVLLSALARRIKVPYPTFLAIGGMLLAFVPSSPSWTLEPDLALALFVAPVLMDAAFDTSLRDLRNNWLPVSTLVLVAVGLTTAAVAVLVHWLLPAMPCAASIALRPIVAPPLPAAAAALLRRGELP